MDKERVEGGKRKWRRNWKKKSSHSRQLESKALIFVFFFAFYLLFFAFYLLLFAFFRLSIVRAPVPLCWCPIQLPVWLCGTYKLFILRKELFWNYMHDMYVRDMTFWQMGGRRRRGGEGMDRQKKDWLRTENHAKAVYTSGLRFCQEEERGRERRNENRLNSGRGEGKRRKRRERRGDNWTSLFLFFPVCSATQTCNSHGTCNKSGLCVCQSGYDSLTNCSTLLPTSPPTPAPTPTPQPSTAVNSKLSLILIFVCLMFILCNK